MRLLSSLLNMQRDAALRYTEYTPEVLWWDGTSNPDAVVADEAEWVMVQVDEDDPVRDPIMGGWKYCQHLTGTRWFVLWGRKP